MKHLVALTLMTACGLAGAQAQPTDADPLGGKGTPTASPNRTSSATLAGRKAHGKADPNRLGNTHFALTFVDAQGATMGRAVGANAFLTTYQGESLLVTGIASGNQCDYSTRHCPNTPGVGWSRSYPYLMYAESNCTGQPYLYYPPAAPASLLGTPVLDQGAWYLYLVRPAETAWLRYASYFAYWGSCYNSSYYDQGTFVAPVVDTIPATDIGSPPFLLK